MTIFPEPTEDMSVIIEKRWIEDGLRHVLYRNLEGERWVIRGTCIACGECEVGANNPALEWTGLPIGTPGACIDRTYRIRLDVPVRHELTVQMRHCSLDGEYLA